MSLVSAGKTAKEEPLLPTHEQRAPEDHPRAGRGLRRGERELRQRAQTQRGHHSPKVRLCSNGSMNMFASTRSPDTFCKQIKVWIMAFYDVCSFSGGSRPVRTQRSHL